MSQFWKTFSEILFEFTPSFFNVVVKAESLLVVISHEEVEREDFVLEVSLIGNHLESGKDDTLALTAEEANLFLSNAIGFNIRAIEHQEKSEILTEFELGILERWNVVIEQSDLNTNLRCILNESIFEDFQVSFEIPSCLGEEDSEISRTLLDKVDVIL